MRWLCFAAGMILATPVAALAVDPNTWQSWWIWVQLVIIQGSGGTIW